MTETETALHSSESQASFQSSNSNWGAENSGIQVPPGTLLHEIAVLDLHPTQLAVGMQQVQDKMKKLLKKKEKGPEALAAFLQGHPVPVVLGPGGRAFLIDHHHLARAMHNLGIKTCFAGTVRDFSGLTPEQFWLAMGQHGFLWPHDQDGNPVPLDELPGLLPDTVAGLRDDPYRSLAALVRKAGGYQKSSKPFSEFMWGNHLRARVQMVLQDVSDVEAYVPQGLSHAVHSEAANLPGYAALQSLSTDQPSNAQSCSGGEQQPGIEGS